MTGGRGSGSGLNQSGSNEFRYINGQPVSLAGWQAAEKAFKRDFNIPQDIQDKTAAALREVFRVNGFYMEIDARHIENVLDEHFKNQFEVGGQSGGASFDASDMTQRNARVMTAVNLFGLDETKLNRRDYEKYGYLNSMDFNEAILHRSGYGDTLIRFKKERLWDRTTYTLDDSLGMDTVAGRVNKPSIAGFDERTFNSGRLNETAIENALTSVRVPKEFASKLSGGYSAYLELQYHGELSMRDVEEITYKIGRYGSTMPSLRVQKRIAKLGIKQYMYDPITQERKEIKP